MCRKLLYLLHTVTLFAVTISFSHGQQTAIYQDPEARYRTGIELFENEMYGGAQKAFAEVILQTKDEQSLLYINSRYYEAACACELQNADAEYKLTRFIEDYPESASTQHAYFQLGRYQFQQADYSSALKSMEQVDQGSLSQAEKMEYCFKKGFCFYKKKEYNKARTEFYKLLGKESAYADDAMFYYAHIAYIENDYATALEYFEKIRHIRAYDKLIPYYLAHIYHQQGEYEKAIVSAEPLFNASSGKDKDELALIIGDAHYQLGHYQEALPFMEYYSRSHQHGLDRDISYEIGFTYFGNGRYNDAIDFFQQATQEDDAISQNAYYHLGYCYLETDQKKFASNAFAAASKYDFDKEVSEDALFNFAKLSMEVSHDPYNSAIKNLEYYIQQYPASPRIGEAYEYLANLYLSTRNYKEALSSISKIKNKNKDLKIAHQKILYFRAVELFNQNLFEEAIALFKESQQYNFDRQMNNESELWIGEAFYRMDNLWAAIKYYNNYLSKADAEAELYPLALYNLGYTHFKRKDYENAVSSWEKLAAHKRNADPKMLNDALIRTGDAYLIRKQYPQAIRYYDEAIRMNKVDTDYALNQKSTAQGAQGRFNEKIKTLNQLISNYPDSPLADGAKYEIASTFLLMNNNQQALAYFNKVVQENPRSSYAVRSMLKSGLVYYDMNQYEQSISVFKNVISKYPGSPESKEALASLRNVYVDINQVGEYYAYANKLGFADISMAEQDSVTYTAAEKIYMENRCSDAIVAFGSYIEKFSQGFFAPNANYYMAECLMRDHDTTRALDAFRRVIALPRSRFTEKALSNASGIVYGKGDYQEALDYYGQLAEVAGDKNSLLLAFTGQMQCNYLLNNYSPSISAARKVLQTETVSSESIVNAHFIMAKSFFALEDLDNARREFAITENLTNSAVGAESKYYLAYLAFMTGKDLEAENLIFELVDQYQAYDYWVARGFILLSDIYVKSGNIFQARQTLQSVIDNYEGPELGELARNKLQSLTEAEQTGIEGQNLQKQ